MRWRWTIATMIVRLIQSKETIELKGARKSWTFNAYPRDTEFEAVGAVYVQSVRMAKANGGGSHKTRRPLVTLRRRTFPNKSGEADPLRRSESAIYCKGSLDAGFCLVHLVQRSDGVSPRG